MELEITENIEIIHSDMCIQKLLQLKAMGIRIAMDDFGKGYSSLDYLVHYPIDVIKLDKGFAQALHDSSGYAVLMKSLIELAHRLHLEVVAEGVEYLEQLEFCKVHDCDAVQGYFTGRPMPSDEVEPFLRSGRSFSVISAKNV
ncbi:EAL domain-containing protein [Paenibacillus filicis]|uniref:EAL domain-containing protein n=1 Tax=Paenibacillus gyeongsangnamensis TaxID=3388067 RepID=A0ABT4QIC6_9BACL|nr:EAL domain-containing protein [Paenibacillus filicis]MCZ8516618.1 EAL domain-containing protein [Paenibacillus filicis]